VAAAFVLLTGSIPAASARQNRAVSRADALGATWPAPPCPLSGPQRFARQRQRRAAVRAGAHGEHLVDGRAAAL